jgi:hypothetical protein
MMESNKYLKDPETLWKLIRNNAVNSAVIEGMSRKRAERVADQVLKKLQTECTSR